MPAFLFCDGQIEFFAPMSWSISRQRHIPLQTCHLQAQRLHFRPSLPGVSTLYKCFKRLLPSLMMLQAVGALSMQLGSSCISLLGLLEVSTLYKFFREPAAVTDDVAGCRSLSQCKWVAHVSLCFGLLGAVSNELGERGSGSLSTNTTMRKWAISISPATALKLSSLVMSHYHVSTKVEPLEAFLGRCWPSRAGKYPSSTWFNLFATSTTSMTTTSLKLQGSVSLQPGSPAGSMRASHIHSKGGITTTGSKC